MIRFLVVVPTLNSFRDLPRLVRSLQNQSYPHWRVLFVDGPSSEEHRSYLDRVTLEDSRFSWIAQSHPHLHIFGAMNQGWLNTSPDEAVLFWGSDDWAANNSVFEDIVSSLTTQSFPNPDVLICSARYFDHDCQPVRVSRFTKSGIYGINEYKNLLFLGCVPPHQATVFMPSYIWKDVLYDQRFLLAADLEFFLSLSKKSELLVSVLNMEVVNISSGGISQRKPLHRLREVLRAYFSIFSLALVIPFLLRYFRRILDLYLI